MGERPTMVFSLTAGDLRLRSSDTLLGQGKPEVVGGHGASDNGAHLGLAGPPDIRMVV